VRHQGFVARLGRPSRHWRFTTFPTSSTLPPLHITNLQFNCSPSSFYVQNLNYDELQGTSPHGSQQTESTANNSPRQETTQLLRANENINPSKDQSEPSNSQEDILIFYHFSLQMHIMKLIHILILVSFLLPTPSIHYPHSV
jgi:hypothetical protein